jgi:hypothetical protein
MFDGLDVPYIVDYFKKRDNGQTSPVFEIFVTNLIISGREQRSQYLTVQTVLEISGFLA